MPKDRGAEQGDVDGPLERSLALGMMAAETRWRIAAQQAAGSLRGLAWTIHQNYSDSKQTTQPECRSQPTSTLTAWKSLRCPRPAACVAEKRRLGRPVVPGRR